MPPVGAGDVQQEEALLIRVIKSAEQWQSAADSMLNDLKKTSYLKVSPTHQTAPLLLGLIRGADRRAVLSGWLWWCRRGS